MRFQRSSISRVVLLFLVATVVIALAPTTAYGACSGASASTKPGAKIYRGDILRFSYGQTIKSLPPAQRDAFNTAFRNGRSEWNKGSCNVGGDDFPWITVVSPQTIKYYPPGLKRSGSTILDVKVNYYATQGIACSVYNHMTHRLSFYAKRPGSNADCEAKQFFDRIASGKSYGHMQADLEALIAHEVGHAFGLGEAENRPECIMGPQQLGLRGGKHWHKTAQLPTGPECNDLDKLTSNGDEIRRECDLHPERCTETTTPPPGGGGADDYVGDGLFPYDPFDPFWPPSIDDLEPVPVVTTTEVYCIFINVFFCFCEDEKGC